MEKVAKKLGATIHYKTESSFMKFLGWLLFFNKSFMTGYTTTIGNRVYFSRKIESDEEYFRRAITLAHELVHVEDYQKHKILFPIIYLLPQLLAVFSLLAIFGIWNTSFFWCLLFLIFLFPIPSPGRMWAEVRGYSISMAVLYWTKRQLQPDYAPYLESFTGSNYYWMWPFESDLRERFDLLKAAIKTNNIYKVIPLSADLRTAVSISKLTR